MRQYTNKEQTQHLIELGFPEPKPSFYQNGASWIMCDGNYSIGELIEFLGLHLMDIHATTICDLPIHYVVQYQRDPQKVAYKEIQGELIDKLYEACVELRNEGVI